AKRLRCPGVGDEITLYEDEAVKPWTPLPKATVPLASVPMKLPCTILLPAVPSMNAPTPTPDERLPEMILRAPATAPPSTLPPRPPPKDTPWIELGSAFVPV